MQPWPSGLQVGQLNRHLVSIRGRLRASGGSKQKQLKPRELTITAVCVVKMGKCISLFAQKTARISPNIDSSDVFAFHLALPQPGAYPGGSLCNLSDCDSLFSSSLWMSGLSRSQEFSAFCTRICQDTPTLFRKEAAKEEVEGKRAMKYVKKKSSPTFARTNIVPENSSPPCLRQTSQKETVVRQKKSHEYDCHKHGRLTCEHVEEEERQVIKEDKVQRENTLCHKPEHAVPSFVGSTEYKTGLDEQKLSLNQSEDSCRKRAQMVHCTCKASDADVMNRTLQILSEGRRLVAKQVDSDYVGYIKKVSRLPQEDFSGAQIREQLRHVGDLLDVILGEAEIEATFEDILSSAEQERGPLHTAIMLCQHFQPAQSSSDISLAGVLSDEESEAKHSSRPSRTARPDFCGGVANHKSRPGGQSRLLPKGDFESEPISIEDLEDVADDMHVDSVVKVPRTVEGSDQKTGGIISFVPHSMNPEESSASSGGGEKLTAKRGRTVLYDLKELELMAEIL